MFSERFILKANSETGKTSHRTCYSEVNFDPPSATRGAEAAGVHALVTASRVPQQQGGVPRDQSIGEELSPPFKLWVLVVKSRTSVLVPVNFFRQAPHPGDWHFAEFGLSTLFVQDAAEEHILAEVGGGRRVAAHQLGQGACGDQDTNS